jgi:hypothetical protein
MMFLRTQKTHKREKRTQKHESTMAKQHHNDHQTTTDETSFVRQPRSISAEDEMMFGPGRTFEDVVVSFFVSLGARGGGGTPRVKRAARACVFFFNE